MAGALGRPSDQALDRESLSEVLGDIDLSLSNAVVSGGWCLQIGAELGLPPRAAKEHHQLASDPARKLTSAILLDEGQGQVDAGCHACGGLHVIALNIDCLSIRRNVGETLGKSLRGGPMRGYGAALEPARLGEDECSRTYGDTPDASRVST